MEEGKVHALVQTVSDELTKVGLPPINVISEEGVELNKDVTDGTARYAINRDLRRRLVKHELATGEQTVELRRNLFDDGMDKTWLYQIKLEVIPALATIAQTGKLHHNL